MNDRRQARHQSAMFALVRPNSSSRCVGGLVAFLTALLIVLAAAPTAAATAPPQPARVAAGASIVVQTNAISQPLEGIDVSNWQASIDWTKVAAAGKAFAIIKASEGTSYTDPYYATNHDGARAAGLRTGAYHFAQPDATPNDAILEADHFVAVLGLVKGDLIPALDLEVSGGLNVTALQAWVTSWLGEVTAKLGVRPMIYTSPNFWKNNMGDSSALAAAGYKTLWIAHWGVTSPTMPANGWGGHGWTFWQYTSSGSVPGISTGRVDLDRYNGTDLTGVTFGADFALSANPAARVVEQGTETSFSISVARTFFTLPIDLSVTGLPAGATGTFDIAPASGMTSTLTIDTSRIGPMTPAGNYPLTITGVSGGLTRMASATLVVNPISGATYHPLDPSRLLDTRIGVGLSGTFSSGHARTFQVTGRGGVPGDATAVTGNLTVTGQTAGGYLFLGPVATNSPTSSTLNFPVGDNRANGLTVALGAGGTLSATYITGTSGKQAQVIFDVTGYFTPDATGATYHPLDPSRLLDTRIGDGLSGTFSSGHARTFQVTGRGGVPGDATAVTGNLTVTGQTAGGYLFLGPVATNSPTSSTLNFPVGDNRANGLTVALGAGGTLSATYITGTSGKQAQVIFDVTGYFTPDATGATYHPLDPSRLLDTRIGVGLSGTFSSGHARTFQVTGRGGVPGDATAVTGNLTVTGQTAGGYLFLGPVATNSPTSSTLNFPVGDNRANGLTVALGAGGTLSATYITGTSGKQAQVIFDVTGYFR